MFSDESRAARGTEHEQYLLDKGIDEDSATDWWGFYTGGFAGSVYFLPQNAEKDIGNAVLDNALITQAWIAFRTADVLAGTLILKGCTIIDFRGAGYSVGTGVLSNNTNPDFSVVAEDFHILYDEPGTEDGEGVYAPEGTKYFAPHTVACLGEPEVTYYRIDIIMGAGGTSTPSTPVYAAQGGSSPFITFTPNAGYFIKDVKVDGASVGAVKSYTFANVQKNHAIEVVFASGSVTQPPQTGDNATFAGFGMLARALAAAAIAGVRKIRAK